MRGGRGRSAAPRSQPQPFKPRRVPQLIGGGDRRRPGRRPDRSRSSRIRRRARPAFRQPPCPARSAPGCSRSCTGRGTCGTPALPARAEGSVRDRTCPPSQQPPSRLRGASRGIRSAHISRPQGSLEFIGSMPAAEAMMLRGRRPAPARADRRRSMPAAEAMMLRAACGGRAPRRAARPARLTAGGGRIGADRGGGASPGSRRPAGGEDVGGGEGIVEGSGGLGAAAGGAGRAPGQAGAV